MRVVVQHAERLLRDAVALTLERGGLRVVGLTGEVARVSGLVTEHRANVAVVEYVSGSSELAQIGQRMKRQVPLVRVVSLVDRELNEVDARRGHRWGWCLVSRQAAVADLFAAVVQGLVPGPLARSHVNRAPSAEITEPDRQILTLIGGGCTTREIAVTLGLSEKCVENRKQRLFDRLGVQNRTQAVLAALSQGAIRSHDALSAVATRW